MSKDYISPYMSEWMRDKEESPVVMSSRIRLARNLENHAPTYVSIRTRWI